MPLFPALATTFLDDKTIQVKIITAPTSSGLCKVVHDGQILVRHKDRLTPINQEAKEMLGVG